MAKEKTKEIASIPNVRVHLSSPRALILVPGSDALTRKIVRAWPAQARWFRSHPVSVPIPTLHDFRSFFSPKSAYQLQILKLEKYAPDETQIGGTLRYWAGTFLVRHKLAEQQY